MKTSELTEGSWTTRWGNWTLDLRARKGNAPWEAVVGRWPPGSAISTYAEIGRRHAFKTPKEATAWACDVMRADGAKVMVFDAPVPVTLELLLQFQPAIDVVR